MKKIKELKYILILLVFALSACAPNSDFQLYKGNPLRIAVVGEPPEVRKEQVRFATISFDEMINQQPNTFDAVFITDNNLTEAAGNQYAEVYVNSTIPFFFIGTDAYAPFTEKDLEYDKSMNWTPGKGYAVGVLTLEDGHELKFWKYGLYNDEKKDEHINDVYTRIFKTIYDLKQ